MRKIDFSEKEWSGIQTVFSEADFSQTLLLPHKQRSAGKARACAHGDRAICIKQVRKAEIIMSWNFKKSYEVK